MRGALIRMGYSDDTRINHCGLSEGIFCPTGKTRKKKCILTAVVSASDLYLSSGAAGLPKRVADHVEVEDVVPEGSGVMRMHFHPCVAKSFGGSHELWRGSSLSGGGTGSLIFDMQYQR